MDYCLVLDEKFNLIFNEDNSLLVKKIPEKNKVFFENYKIVNYGPQFCLVKSEDNEQFFLKDNSFVFSNEIFSIGFCTTKESLKDKNIFVVKVVNNKEKIEHFNYYSSRTQIQNTHTTKVPALNNEQQLTSFILEEVKQTFKSLERLNES